MKSEIDWTTTDGCPRCNEHGPLFPSGLIYDPWGDRARHQAWHEFTGAFLTEVTAHPWRTIGRYVGIVICLTALLQLWR